MNVLYPLRTPNEGSGPLCDFALEKQGREVNRDAEKTLRKARNEVRKHKAFYQGGLHSEDSKARILTLLNELEEQVALFRAKVGG